MCLCVDESMMITVTSGNFNVVMKNCFPSFRLLALFPPFDSRASHAAFRRKELTHEGVAIVLNKLQPFLNKACDISCASTDGLLRRLVPLFHFLSMDGQEIFMHVIVSVEWESEMFVGTTRLHVRTLDNFHGKIRTVVSVS